MTLSCTDTLLGLIGLIAFFWLKLRCSGISCASVSSFDTVKKVDSKCYMCERRHPACQDKCPDYLAWKANLDANKAKIADERKKFEDINSYQRDTAGRLYKKK